MELQIYGLHIKRVPVTHPVF